MLKTMIVRATTAAILASLSLSAQAIADERRLVDIPAGDLRQALLRVSEQFGTDLVYSPEQVQGIKTPGAHGRLTTEQAVTELLKGTPLELRTDPSGAMLIAPTAASAKEVSRPSVDASAQSKSFWSRVRLAQVDTSSSSPVERRREARTSEADEDSARSQETIELEEILVTGTHIRGAAPASPVITLGQQAIARSGYTDVGNLMRSLPQNFSGGSNPGTNIGVAPNNLASANNPAGASAPNLRGLGPGSTLTLINGRRFAQGLPGGGADIGAIPLDAIDRIEVLTDSASAVYGADAVAGVVNVILKPGDGSARTGVAVGGATEGGGFERRMSQTLGTDWQGGDAFMGYEYSRQDAVDSSDRTFTQSAPRPFSLLPEVKRHSAIASVNQALNEDISTFVDGFYTSRDVNYLNSELADPSSWRRNPTSARQYSGAAGVRARIGEWRSTFFGAAGEDKTDQDVFVVDSVTAESSLTNIQHFLGRHRSLEINANGPLASLDAGQVLAAVGAGYRWEAFMSGIFFPGIPGEPHADTRREVSYAFAEVTVPLLRPAEGSHHLDLIASGRYERYTDFGSKTVPKVGLVYSPVAPVTLRGTWGEAFRAPNLNDMSPHHFFVLVDLPDDASPTGVSSVLAHDGGNAGLQPELARTWSFGIDYAPLPHANLSLSYFDITYSQRISQIANVFAALNDPLNEFFLVRSPSAEYQQQLIDQSGSMLLNFTSHDYDPLTTAAVLEFRLVNVARQEIRGVDFNIDYSFGAPERGVDVYLNAAYLELDQQNVPAAASTRLSGTVFNPPKWRARGGATWNIGPWSLTGVVNYLHSEINTVAADNPRVGSWTTVDASIAYTATGSGMLSGVRAALSAQNVFDRDPPYMQFSGGFLEGFNYDSLNVTPIGRLIALQVSKKW